MGTMSAGPTLLHIEYAKFLNGKLHGLKLILAFDLRYTADGWTDIIL